MRIISIILLVLLLAVPLLAATNYSEGDCRIFSLGDTYELANEKLCYLLEHQDIYNVQSTTTPFRGFCYKSEFLNEEFRTDLMFDNNILDTIILTYITEQQSDLVSVATKAKKYIISRYGDPEHNFSANDMTVEYGHITSPVSIWIVGDKSIYLSLAYSIDEDYKFVTIAIFPVKPEKQDLII